MKKSILFILLCQFSSSEAYSLSEICYKKILSSSHEKSIESKQTGIDKSSKDKKYSGKKSYCNVKGLLCIGIGVALPFLFNLMKNEKTPIIHSPSIAVPGIGGILNDFIYKNDSIPQNFANTKCADLLPVSKISYSPLTSAEVNQNVIEKISSEESIISFKKKYINNKSLTNGMRDHLISKGNKSLAIREENQNTAPKDPCQQCIVLFEKNSRDNNGYKQEITENSVQIYSNNETDMCEIPEGNKSLAISYSPVLTCETYKKPTISDKNSIEISKQNSAVNEMTDQAYKNAKTLTSVISPTLKALALKIEKRLYDSVFDQYKQNSFLILSSFARDNNIKLGTKFMKLFSNEPVNENFLKNLIKISEKATTSKDQNDLREFLSMLAEDEDNDIKKIEPSINKANQKNIITIISTNKEDNKENCLTKCRDDNKERQEQCEHDRNLEKIKYWDVKYYDYH